MDNNIVMISEWSGIITLNKEAIYFPVEKQVERGLTCCKPGFKPLFGWLSFTVPADYDQTANSSELRFYSQSCSKSFSQLKYCPTSKEGHRLRPSFSLSRVLLFIIICMTIARDKG